jgi:hypothetical protein
MPDERRTVQPSYKIDLCSKVVVIRHRMNYCTETSTYSYTVQRSSVKERSNYTRHLEALDSIHMESILLRELDGENRAISGDATHRQVVSTWVRHLKTVILRPKHQRCTTE